jgi:hypothetical protein
VFPSLENVLETPRPDKLAVGREASQLLVGGLAPARGNDDAAICFSEGEAKLVFVQAHAGHGGHSRLHVSQALPEVKEIRRRKRLNRAQKIW